MAVGGPFIQRRTIDDVRHCRARLACTRQQASQPMRCNLRKCDCLRRTPIFREQSAHFDEPHLPPPCLQRLPLPLSLALSRTTNAQKSTFPAYTGIEVEKGKQEVCCRVSFRRTLSIKATHSHWLVPVAVDLRTHTRSPGQWRGGGGGGGGGGGVQEVSCRGRHCRRASSVQWPFFQSSRVARGMCTHTWACIR